MECGFELYDEGWAMGRGFWEIRFEGLFYTIFLFGLISEVCKILRFSVHEICEY